jgi:hypothetical protein
MSNRASDGFKSALEEAASNDRAAGGRDEGATGRRRVRGVAFAAAPGSGGAARFGLAMDWADEPVSQPPPPRLPPHQSEPSPACSGDSSAEIAAELGLGETLTLSELTSRWRAFVWRNHPDRLPVEAQAHANARVAIANTLYDRARKDLTTGDAALAHPNKRD